MEEFNVLKNLDRVKAPPGFEQKMMAQLSVQKRQIKARHFRLSLAGAFSAVVVLLVVVDFFIFPQKGLIRWVGLEKGTSDIEGREMIRESDYIPIIESVDYSGEIRSISQEPSTIYILEQVSDETSAYIKY
ncbi:MAG: hypothetical protein ACLFVG_07475 [Candidatus Aminicenantes bacterium]